jgi:hypothetical protein
MTNNITTLTQQAKEKAIEVKKIELAYREACKPTVPEAEANLKNLVTARAEMLADAAVYGEPPNAKEVYVLINREIEEADQALKEAQRADLDAMALAEAIHKRLVVAHNEQSGLQNAILNERKAIISIEIENIENKAIKAAGTLISDVMKLEYLISIGNAQNLFERPRYLSALPAKFNLPIIENEIVIDPNQRREIYLKTHAEIATLLNLDE